MSNPNSPINRPGIESRQDSPKKDSPEKDLIEDESLANSLTNSLRRKEGNWIAWASACEKLQISGQSLQQIFEQTGFEPIHQNQITVAAKVYAALVEGEANPVVLNHFAEQGSEILYELRVLPQSDRLNVAEFILQQKLEISGTKELVKAIKEFTMLANPPQEFTTHPGDAIAYQAYRSAQNNSDSQQRTKYILRGLQYVYSSTARGLIEQLLTTSVSAKPAKPINLPIYRLEEEEQLPRSIAVAGKLPLTVLDFKSVPIIEELPPFGMVIYEGACAWVALPGWRVVREAEDGVAILADTDTFWQASKQKLPNSFPDRPEQILILVDRAQREPDQDSYFAIEVEGKVQFQPFNSESQPKILGKILLVLRQQRVLDEGAMEDMWGEEE